MIAADDRTASRRRRSAIAGACVAAVAAVAVGLTALDRAFPPDIATMADRAALVVDREGRPLRGFTTAQGMWRFAATPDEVDPLYLEMLKAFEDRRFDSHPGVDPLAVLRAVGQLVLNGRVVSGASTLTMQTARLLEPRPRTLVAKLTEMGRAIQLERQLGKDGVLARYLTLAPYGGNLEGIKAASLFYLGKLPRRLTPAEAALLVVLPQRPSALRPDRHPERARAARDKVLYRMAEAGVLTEAEVASATAVPVPQTRRPQPFTAPLLARRVHRAAPARDVVATPLDLALQKTVESLVTRHLAPLEPGLSAAVIVVENDDRSVRASIGSAGFFAADRGGQVDMTTAPRSPGSTLKPFVYGMGFEAGFLHPATRIEDRPTRFGDYAPENFDKRHYGTVTVREALRLSLNIPAVAVLDRLGPARLARRLEEAGARLVIDSRVGRPTLPIALGGVGISLEHLVTLFAGLAEDGMARPLRWTTDAPAAAGVRLLDPAAAWQVTGILRDTPPPPDRTYDRDRATARGLAFKTGTSYGFRDAWAVGYDDRWTVGVWVGRPDGGFGSRRIGRVAAAPLLFDVFDLLPAPRSEPEAPPASVLIAESRDLPPPLRDFARRGAARLVARRAAPGGPELRFPIDGAELDWDGTDAVMLEADGGRRPLTWLVDGRPIPAPGHRRRAAWRPAGPGAHTLTLLDAEGRVARARVWLR